MEFEAAHKSNGKNSQHFHGIEIRSNFFDRTFLSHSLSLPFLPLSRFMCICAHVRKCLLSIQREHLADANPEINTQTHTRTVSICVAQLYFSFGSSTLCPTRLIIAFFFLLILPLPYYFTDSQFASLSQRERLPLVTGARDLNLVFVCTERD